jgi:hypothetical protein
MRTRSSLSLAFAAGFAIAIAALALRARWQAHEPARERADAERVEPSALAPAAPAPVEPAPIAGDVRGAPQPPPELARGARLGAPESAPAPRAERAFELEGAALDAARVLRVRGAEIERAELELHLALGPGAGLVEARCLALWGRHIAAAAGLAYGLSETQWRAYLDAWAELRGRAPADAEVALAAASGLPRAAALAQRRDLLEGLLAFLDVRVARGAAEGALSGLEAAAALLPQYARARAELAQPGRMRELATLLEALALVAQPALRAELEPRIFSALDCALPAEHVAGVDLSAEPRADAAPWENPGPHAWIESAPIAAAFTHEAELARSARTAALRELVSLRALRAALADAGAWGADAADWHAWRAELLASRSALLALDAQGALFAGMPSAAHQRAHARIRRAQRRLQDARPATDEELRAFWLDNRALVERWPIELELALFPPRQSAAQAPDWRAAQQRAADFAAELARAAPDERSFARRAQAFALELEAGLGAAAALDWRTRCAEGRVRLDVLELETWLQESNWQRALWGTSCARATLAHLALGEASPAWRAPIGWVVLRAASAQPPPALPEFESVRTAAAAALEEARWLAWVDAALAAARIEPVR